MGNATRLPLNTPRTYAKAARLAKDCVVPRSDGGYDVAGDHGTYLVRWSFYTERWYCQCQATHLCSHVLAVTFYLKDKQKAGKPS